MAGRREAPLGEPVRQGNRKGQSAGGSADRFGDEAVSEELTIKCQDCMQGLHLAHGTLAPRPGGRPSPSPGSASCRAASATISGARMSPWISPAPLAGLDVTPGQVGVLPVIAAGPGLSQTALGR